jgi:transposase-like protein
MGQTVIRYSEAFKRQVVDEIERGKFTSLHKARKAYRITGCGTIESWIRKYGRDDLLPKIVRIESMKERDEIKEARQRIKNLEAALADAHIDCSLGNAFLKIACKRMGVDVEDFKKKNAVTLSDIRKTRNWM